MSAGNPGLGRPRAAARRVTWLTRILGCLLLVVACLPGHAQDAAAEPAATPVAKAEAGAADTAAIALVDIAERANADEGFAQATRLQAQSTDAVADLQPRLDDIRASIHMKQAALHSSDLRAIPIARLESLSR